MERLTEEKLIELMREEWSKNVLQLEKSLRAFMKTPEGEKLILGVGTRVKHTGSGLLYTIVAVDQGRNQIILKPTMGEEFPVSGDAFEGERPEYELD